jgi:hypothetical protein
MTDEPSVVKLSEQQAQEILNYLIQHPYMQVHHLVGYLLAAQPPKEPS